MPQLLLHTDLVRSISFSQEEILNSIIQLYCPKGIQCDVTWGNGNFYKNIPWPMYRYDIKGEEPHASKADCRKLPVADGYFRNLVYDPPFIASWNKKSEEYLMMKYTGMRGIKALQQFYADSIKEFSRVIRHRGILIVKCQDTVNAGKNVFNHIFIHNEAIKNKFVAKDLFILLARQRFHAMETQTHSRKFHSYFWVFRKHNSNVSGI